MNFLVRNFLKGLLVAIPIGFTVYLIYIAVAKLDSLFNTSIPGLGLLVVIGAVTLLGFLTSNVVGRSVLLWAEKMMRKVPVVRLLYTSLKDVVHAMFGERKGLYQPVMVNLFPERNIRAFGFLTRKSLGIDTLEGHVAVYFPQSYNIAGNLLLVPQELVEPVNIESSQMMAFLVSGGVARPTPEVTGNFQTTSS